MIFKLLIVFVLSSIPLSIKTETKIPIRQTCDEKNIIKTINTMKCKKLMTSEERYRLY